MEINVYNINGQQTGRQATLNDEIYAIEPMTMFSTWTSNNIWATNARAHTRPKKEASTRVVPVNSEDKRAAAELAMAISTHP